MARRPAQRPRRILVADDNEDAARALSKLLELLGCEVWVAHDGVRAVELAAEFHPEMAFLDIGMPRMDGQTAARRIREEAWGRDIILIAVTGWGQEADRARAQIAGFDQHLVKPVDPSQLDELLTGS